MIKPLRIATNSSANFKVVGTLVNTSGHLFHVTNTAGVINLDGVTINDTGAGVILSVCDDGWSGASNVATLNATNQTLSGDILVGEDSTLSLNLTGLTFTGNISGVITNNAGTSISTSIGTVNVSLDSSSKWYLNKDNISTFDGVAANVINNGYTLYENNVEVTGTTESEDTDTLPTGLTYNDEKTVLTASSSFTGNSINLADYESTGDASAVSTGVSILGNTLANSLLGKSGNEKLRRFHLQARATT